MCGKALIMVNITQKYNTKSTTRKYNTEYNTKVQHKNITRKCNMENITQKYNTSFFYNTHTKWTVFFTAQAIQHIIHVQHALIQHEVHTTRLYNTQIEKWSNFNKAEKKILRKDNAIQHCIQHEGIKNKIKAISYNTRFILHKKIQPKVGSFCAGLEALRRSPH